MRVKTAVGLTGVLGTSASLAVIFMCLCCGHWLEANGHKGGLGFFAVLLGGLFATLGLCFSFIQLLRWQGMNPTRNLWDPIEESKDESPVQVRHGGDEAGDGPPTDGADNKKESPVRRC